MNFCHLHVHDEYSLLDGFGRAEDYAKKAKNLGMKYLALTNHGNIDGLINFQKACLKHEIEPILGCEAYIVPDMNKKIKGEKRGHITLLVKNEQGFRNLCRMLTQANLEGMYYKPRIDFALLRQHYEGLVVLSGCSSSFLNVDADNIMLQWFANTAVDFYLEIMPHNMPEQISINERCLGWHNMYGIPMVATNDCHYVRRDDAKAHEVLLAIQTQATWNDRNRYKFSIDGFHLRDALEMINEFIAQDIFCSTEVEEAMDNTIEIAEMCAGFRIPKQAISLPTLPAFEGKDIDESVYRLAEDQLLAMGLTELVLETYYDRLDTEMDVIISKGFSKYFLIVWELVNWCKQNGIMVGPGRGSVGGSLTAYLLGITTVNPIKYNLLFSRFITEDRIDYPDIDLDFEDHKRPMVRGHLEALYGKENIASLSTFMKMKGRTTMRDVCRVFDVPLKEVEAFAKIINDTTAELEEDGSDIIAATKTEEGAKFFKKHPHVIEYAAKLEGIIRGAGQHASALLVSAEPLTNGNRCNLVIRKNEAVANWNMSDSEHVGLIKLDVLGLNALSVLNEVKRLIQVKTKENFEFEKIPLDDPAVYAEISAGHTAGVFQLLAHTTKKYCKLIKPQSMGELSDTIALVRPGPLDCVTGDTIIRVWGGAHCRIDEIDIGRPIVSSAFVEGQGNFYVRNKVKMVSCTGTKEIFEVQTEGHKIIQATNLHKFFVKKPRPPKHYWAKRTQYTEGKWMELKEIEVNDLVLTRCLNVTNRKGTVHHTKMIEGGQKTQFKKGGDPWNKGVQRFMDYFYASSETPEAKEKRLKKWHMKMFGTDQKREASRIHCKQMAERDWGNQERSAHSKIMQEYYKKNSHPNSRGYFVSKPQKEIFSAAQKWFIDAELDYRFPFVDKYGHHRDYLLDVAIPSMKIDIEFDGEYWHDMPGERVEPRDTVIEKSGWKIIRLTKKTYKEFIVNIGNLSPHNNVKWSKILSIESKGKQLTYDLTTENQNFPNYIANDFIVHNSGMCDTYIQRKETGNGWQRKHPKYEAIVKETYGIVIYQEQVMDVIFKVAGLPYTTADKIRKVISKKRDPKEFKPYEDAFIEGCLKEKTFSKQEAEEFWQVLQNHARYSFNKSHSVEYALIGYWCAWCKLYYPEEFIIASLTYGQEGKKEDIVEEAARLGIVVKTPRVGISKATNWVAIGKEIYAPFLEIKGIGEKAATECERLGKQNAPASNKFFMRKTEIPARSNGKLDTLLKSIGAYGEPPTEEDISIYFNFTVSSIQRKMYPNMMKLLEDRHIRSEDVEAYYGLTINAGQISPLIQESSFKGYKDSLSKCTQCELRKECKQPVPPSPGAFNVVIVGEAPGENEDEAKKGFVGKAGNLLWSTLENYQYVREDFHVTNASKCYPAQSKTPSPKQLATCRVWLEEEMRQVQPVLILAFGNTGMHTFAGKNKGISEMSGKTTWNEEFSAWICWCVHPASVLRNPGNKALFNDGIKNFVDKINLLAE